jgi:hypothetical protein
VSTLDVPLGPIAPRCATHLEEAASGTCSRCGTFFCTACVQWIFDQPWCPVCAARPEVNYLERFRRKLWGRRDAAAWVTGALGLALTAVALRAMWQQRTFWLPGLLMVACAASCTAFFVGWRRAREALIATTLGCAAGFLAFGSQVSSIVFLFGAVFATFLYFDTRNRLFFQQPVSASRLQRLWHERENNPRARDAMNLGLASLLFPLFAPLAVIIGVVALQRVDPHATPPIGRKGQAIAGIALGTIMMLLWGVMVWTVMGSSSSGEGW